MDLQELDDKQQVTASSPETTIVDEAVGAEQAPEASAGSSSATDGGKTPEKSMVDVVRDVVADARKKPEASSAESGAEAPKAAAEPTDKTKERDDVDYTDVPFHKHPRFQEVLRRAKVNEADAGRYRNVQNFLDQNALDAEAAADILVVAALAKVDPRGALDRLRPWLTDLLHRAGEVVPQDLRQRVAAGDLNDAAAKELAQARAAIQAAEARRTLEIEREERQRAQRLATDVTSAVDAWEADRRLKDPNFEQKLDQIRREIVFLQHTEGKPGTPEGVREQLDKAYRNISASLTPSAAGSILRQQRQAVRPITGGQVASASAGQAKSILDIVKSARGA